MFGMINAPNILKGSAKLKDSGKRPKYIVEHQLKYFFSIFSVFGVLVYWD